MQPITSAPSAAPEPQGGRLERIALRMHRYRYVLAPISFGIGVGSFLLVQRKDGLAQWIALILLLVWLVSTVEVAAARWLKLSPAVLRFITQQAHQEAFFFTLPFLLRTTSWDSGQGVFTGGVIVAALCSMWDPLYFGRIATRPWLLLSFHALAAYVAMLVALPLVLQLTTAQTLVLASVAMGALALPSLASLFDGRGVLRWAGIFGGAAALGLLAWMIRPWVPPATLWISEGVVTQTVDVASKTPGAALTQVTSQTLVDQGMYAYTAIHVPRGLREQVFHRWMQNGREISKIPLEIAGGREEGYRAWSHKIGFPADPAGAWQVQVVTESGQLIGLVRFRVAADAAVATDAPMEPSSEPPAPSPALTSPGSEPAAQVQQLEEPAVIQPAVGEPAPEPVAEPADESPVKAEPAPAAENQATEGAD
jgi:hypothetical protein